LIKQNNLNNKIYGKNGFAEVSKNSARYRSENNFVWTIKVIKHNYIHSTGLSN